MADFYQKYHLFSSGPSSVFSPPTSPIKMLAFLEEPNKNHINETLFSQFYQPETFDDFPDINVCVHQNGTCPPQGTKATINNNNGTSIICTKITCPNSSEISIKADKKRRKIQQESFPISSQSNKDMEEMKGKKEKKEIKKDKKKANEETQSGYIHVRARRGQATDSHSLAERVRREKISERMRVLQTLVPGCDKVNGKALMLDEIINYVQSLQHQVEFLSMKLATVNPMDYDFDLDIDTLMATTEQRRTALTSPQPLPLPLPLPLQPLATPPLSMQTCNETHQIYSPNSTNPLATSSIFCLLDNQDSLPMHQQILPNISSRGSGQQLWDFNDQIIHKLVNQQFTY